MSSTIVTGVSEKLGFEYLKSYLDKSTSESRFIVDDNNVQIRIFFRTASEASVFIKDYRHIYMSIDYSDFDIYLNRYNRETQLTLADLTAFRELEENEHLYGVFQAYAEKMLDDIDFDEEDQEEYNFIETYPEAEYPPLIQNLIDENEALKLDWCESEIKLNRQLRDVAMDFIFYMNPTDFELRLLSGTLLKFPRALPLYEDYIEVNFLPDILVYPKRPMKNSDIDNNIVNFAYAIRGYLRVMNEDEFKELCYTDIE